MSTKIIIFTIVAIAIVYIVTRMYKTPKREAFKKEKKQDMQHISGTDLNYEYDPNESLDGMCLYDTKPESLLLNTYPLSGEQPLHDMGDNNYYISESYGCKRPVKSVKQFHDEFFKFRDYHTNENSSMRYDPVDKIVNMQLDGDLSKNDAKYKSMKIKDIYDNLTAGTNRYSKLY
uniref:Uncharacterized protein n=1 Tax=Mimivirus LCMiAC02 TaxID=2506609 RepID=A0A481Z099_9VIRU|nr:MAG: hypothetical protein LCMiAC02_00250 [Mimivirus LCMiAC02]